MMKISFSILLGVAALTGCTKATQTYTPCASPVGEVRYLSDNGVEVEKVYRFFGADGLSQRLEWGEEATPSTYPPWHSNERGFFIDGLVSIPANYRRVRHWRTPDIQCGKQAAVLGGQQLISCSIASTIAHDPLVGRPNFLFSPERGITLIAYGPIVTGLETGEAYFRLVSPHHGLGAECPVGAGGPSHPR